MPSREPETLGELLASAYANLTMAHAAVNSGSSRYGRTHFMIRARLNKGLRTGSMNMGTLLDDERVKMNTPRGCSYCGADEKLTIDHLVPRISGGLDTADNSVWACRSCNSSKGATDLLAWWFSRHETEFPPLLLIRRYLKVVAAIAHREALLTRPLDDLGPVSFDVAAIPTSYPQPTALRLWATLPYGAGSR